MPLRCCILLLYKAREPWAQDFEFIYLTWGGAEGIRTPDLLHAIQGRTVAGCGQISPCMLFTCGDSGWAWLGVAFRLASLAPKLAPGNLLALLFDFSNLLLTVASRVPMSACLSWTSTPFFKIHDHMWSWLSAVNCWC